MAWRLSHPRPKARDPRDGVPVCLSFEAWLFAFQHITFLGVVGSEASPIPSTHLSVYGCRAE